MKVRFWIDADESDIYEYKTNLTEDDLESEASAWVDNNAHYGWDIIEEESELGGDSHD